MVLITNIFWLVFGYIWSAGNMAVDEGCYFVITIYLIFWCILYPQQHVHMWRSPFLELNSCEIICDLSKRVVRAFKYIVQKFIYSVIKVSRACHRIWPYQATFVFPIHFFYLVTCVCFMIYKLAQYYQQVFPSRISCWKRHKPRWKAKLSYHCKDGLFPIFKVLWSIAHWSKDEIAFIKSY